LALDLKRLMGRAESSSSEQRCMVIFKPTVGPLFGLVVDEICEIVSLRADQLEICQSSDPNGPNESRSKLVHRIAKLDGQLVVLLNSDMLLPFIETLA
jgi:chemotaxis signal transduction protein